jgi:hypothetical protein
MSKLFDNRTINRCFDCEGINLNGFNMFCYEMGRYIENLDVIHPDCPLENAEEADDASF